MQFAGLYVGRGLAPAESEGIGDAFDYRIPTVRTALPYGD